MNWPVLETKLLIPPYSSGFVARSRLFDLLNAGKGGKLTLVCAPAGFGKTTLLGTWAQGAGRPVVWISLDEGDNDPGRLLTYLVAALQKIDPAIGQSANELLEASQISFYLPSTTLGGPDYEAVLASLINDILVAGKPFAVVLDDYHLVQDKGAHELLRFLIEHRPPGLQIVISARQDPPLPLPRLRARDQLVEIREPQLRFTREEVQAFLQEKLETPPSKQALVSLQERTEGWIAALQLAVLSLKQKDPEVFLSTFRGDDRHIADYLLEEVFVNLPEEIQVFLLYTSILNRLNASLCEALVVDLSLPAPCQQILEDLEAAHLFLLPLDQKRQWYRYHSLFADFLQHQLEAKYPGQVQSLHRRASAWFQEAGEIEEAVAHAFAIADFPRVAWLAEQYGTTMVYGGRLATFLRWIERIPPEEVYQHANLCLDTGWAYALMGKVDKALRFAQAGEAALSNYDPVFIASRNYTISAAEIRGDLITLRAYCARLAGNREGVIHYSQLALEQLPEDAYTVRGVVALNLGLLFFQNWEIERAMAALDEAVAMTLKSGENISVAVNGLCMQGNVLQRQGQLDQAEAYYRRGIEMSAREGLAPGAIPAASLGYFGLAEIHYLRNQVEAAQGCLDEARELASKANTPDLVRHARMLETRLALLAGDLSAAKQLLKASGELTGGTRDEHYEMQRAMLEAELLITQGDSAQAAQTLAGRQFPLRDMQPADQNSAMDRIPEYLLLARLKLHEGRVDEVEKLLKWLGPFSAGIPSVEYRIEISLMQAVAYHMRRAADRAVEFLEEALNLAQPQNFVSPFLKLSSLIAGLLSRRDTAGSADQFEHRVQAALARRNLALKSWAEGLAAGEGFLKEPLTGREQQLLNLLAAGLTSNQVAEELVLSVSTVRSYMKSLYRKLDVHSREQAVIRGKSLGLL